MSWQVGQKLICVRDALFSDDSADARLEGYVKDQMDGWVTIVCADAKVIVSRFQSQFEKDGWQLDRAEPSHPSPTRRYTSIFPKDRA